MASGEGKKIMVKGIGSPLRGVNAMTGRTVGFKTGAGMVWIGRGFIVCLVAGKTFIADRKKTKARFRLMAVRTRCIRMIAQQGERHLPVNVGYLVDEPG